MIRNIFSDRIGPASSRVLRVLLAWACSGLVATSAAAQTPAPNPMQGDGRVLAFYVWDRTIPDQPGRILRTEPLEPELGLSGVSRQTRLLYVSTDGVAGADPVAVSAALFLPATPPPPGGWPLVAWAHGTVGVADICAPSWAGRSFRDARYLEAWLAAGFAIIATDYQGLGVPGPHPYLQARPAAYSILDSVRAALQTDAPLSGKVILLGQSQGGAAVVATAGYATDYAPELNIVGTVATGSGLGKAPTGPPDLSSTAVTPNLAYVFYNFLVAEQVDPTFQADAVFTPAAIGLLAQARRVCIFGLENDAVVAGLSLANALKLDGVVRMQALTVQQMTFPTYALPQPLFIASGVDDRDVPSAQGVALAREACGAGTIVEAHFYRGLDHSGAVNGSLKDSLPFAQRAVAGEPITPRCEPPPEDP